MQYSGIGEIVVQHDAGTTVRDQPVEARPLDGGDVVAAGHLLKAERLLELSHPHVAKYRHILDAEIHILEISVAARKVVLHLEVITPLNLPRQIKPGTTKHVTVAQDFAAKLVIREECVVPMNAPPNPQFVLSVNGLKPKAVLPKNLKGAVIRPDYYAHGSRYGDGDHHLVLTFDSHFFHGQ